MVKSLAIIFAITLLSGCEKNYQDHLDFYLSHPTEAYNKHYACERDGLSHFVQGIKHEVKYECAAARRAYLTLMNDHLYTIKQIYTLELEIAKGYSKHFLYKNSNSLTAK